MRSLYAIIDWSFHMPKLLINCLFLSYSIPLPRELIEASVGILANWRRTDVLCVSNLFRHRRSESGGTVGLHVFQFDTSIYEAGVLKWTFNCEMQAGRRYTSWVTRASPTDVKLCYFRCTYVLVPKNGLLMSERSSRFPLERLRKGMFGMFR